MADRLVRSKTVYQASGTSITATFDEAAALNNTYLLVASVQLGNATAISAPSGWTEVSGGSANSTNQVRTYVKQGDGSTNSITFSVTSAAATVTLMGYSGFVSLTPLATQGGNGTTNTSFTTTAVTANSVPGYGVFIMSIGVLSTVSWGSWSVMTRTGTIANASQRMDVGRVEFNGVTGVPQANVTWGTTRTQRYLGVIMPLLAPPMAEYGFNEGSGTVTVDTSGNGYNLNVSSSAWDASGKTGSALTGSSTGVTLQSTGLPLASLSGYTAMGWINVATTNADSFGETNQIIMFTEKSDGLDFTSFYLDRTGGAGSTFKIGVYNSGTSDTSTYGSASLNTWHHVAFSIDAASTTLYIDGVQVFTDSNPRNIYPDRAIFGNSKIAPGGEHAATLQGKIDSFRTFPYKLASDQITAYMNLPVSPAPVPTVIGIATGSITNTGSVSVTPPVGAAKYLAIVSTGMTDPGSAPNPTAPSGFALYQSGNNSYTAWRIYTGTAAAGSTWQTSVGWSTSVMVIGLSDFEIEASINGGEQNTNPTPDQTAPSVTTTNPSLVIRALTAAPWPGTPTAAYPLGAPTNRTQIFTPSGDEGALVSIATSSQFTAGATGTAAFGYTPLDGSTAHTIALRNPVTRTITYFDSDWATTGTGTGDGTTTYKQVVVTGCQPGDVIVAYGAVENNSTSGTRYVWDVTSGGAKTGTWTELSGMTTLSANNDVDFYAGYAPVTTAGAITIQVGLRYTTSQHAGTGAYLIPASMITSSYGFVGNGFVRSSDGLASATLTATSTVIYMAGDWVAQTMGSTTSPSGGTILRTYSDSAYAIWTGLWSGQTAGTRSYGPSGLGGRRTSGVLFTIGESSAPAASRWYTSTGASLKPYRLTGTGLVELQ